MDCSQNCLSCRDNYVYEFEDGTKDVWCRLNWRCVARVSPSKKRKTKLTLRRNYGYVMFNLAMLALLAPQWVYWVLCEALGVEAVALTRYKGRKIRIIRVEKKL